MQKMCFKRNACDDINCAFLHPRQIPCNRPHDRSALCDYLHSEKQSWFHQKNHKLRQMKSMYQQLKQSHQEKRSRIHHRGHHGPHHKHDHGRELGKSQLPMNQNSGLNHQNRRNRQSHQGYHKGNYQGHRHQHKRHKQYKLKQQTQNTEVSDIFLMMSGGLLESGFKDQKLNIVLLTFLDGNIQFATAVLKNTRKKLEEMKLQQNQIKQLQNLVILQELGFDLIFNERKLNKFIYKCDNNLGYIIQRLKNKCEIQQNKLIYGPKFEALQFNFIDQIPEKSIIVIDGFQTTQCHKHLKKLFNSEVEAIKLESLVRFRLLVETVAEGYIIFEKRILTDLIEQQIEKNIGIEIKNEKKMVTVYTQQPNTTQQTFLNILSQIKQEDRDKVLIVSTNSNLIKSCLEFNKKPMNIMAGTRFVKAVKKMHEKHNCKRLLKVGRQ